MIKKIIRIFLMVVGVIIFILSLTVFYQYKQIHYDRTFYLTDSIVEEKLRNYGFSVLERKNVREGFFPSHLVGQIKAEIPREISLDDLSEKIRKDFFLAGCDILYWKEENKKDTYEILADIGKEEVLTHRLQFLLKKAKIALLIDDFGYTDDGKLLDLFFNQLNIPFSVSIIPGTPFAGEIASRAHFAGKQILVHMPMEPQEIFQNRYKWIILKKMSKEQIKNTLREAIESVPYAEGLNNHMGSLITSREDLMRPILEVLKDKKLFFVDSKTTSQSVGYLIAKKLQVKTASRSVFLDNYKDLAYIKGQFNELLSLALKRGKALGLGHADPRVGTALVSLVKECDTRKFQFVLISEILD